MSLVRPTLDEKKGADRKAISQLHRDWLNGPEHADTPHLESPTPQDALHTKFISAALHARDWAKEEANVDKVLLHLRLPDRYMRDAVRALQQASTIDFPYEKQYVDVQMSRWHTPEWMPIRNDQSKAYTNCVPVTQKVSTAWGLEWAIRAVSLLLLLLLLLLLSPLLLFYFICTHTRQLNSTPFECAGVCDGR